MIIKKSDYLLVFSYTKRHKEILDNVLAESTISNKKLIYFDTGEDNKFVSQKILFLIKYVAAYIYCRSLLFFGANVDVLLPHPEHVIANYFFYNNKINHRYIYEDGLMNYLKVELSGGNLVRAKKRKYIALLFMYKYHIVQGYLTGAQERVINATFLVNPQYAYLPEKHGEIRKITVGKCTNYTYSEGVVLFIDQDIESVYGFEIGTKYRKKIYEKMAKHRLVYVKRHHDYMISMNMQTKFSSDWVEIKSNTTAECLVAELKPQYVYGFFSTALVNISLYYNEISCFCCIPETHIVCTSSGEICFAEFMKKFGVIPI